MPGHLPVPYLLETGMLTVLAVGTALIVAVTAMISGRLASAIWRRTMWQVATSALILLIVCEWTGWGLALSYLVRGPAAADRMVAVQPFYCEPSDWQLEKCEAEPTVGARVPLEGDGETTRPDPKNRSWPGFRTVSETAHDGRHAVALGNRHREADNSGPDNLMRDEKKEFSSVEDAVLAGGGADDRATDGAVDDDAVDGAIDDGAIDDGAIDDGAIDDGAIDGATIDEVAIDDGAIDDGAIDDGAIDGATIDEVAVDDGAIDLLAMDGGAMDGGTRAGAASGDMAAVGGGWFSFECGAGWLAWIWVLGTLVIVLRVVCSRWMLVAFCRRQACVLDGEWAARVEGLAGRLGMRRRVRLLSCKRLATPVALGIVRPTVVLPATFADDFDDAQQDAILAHELAHLAARDPVWQLLAELVVAVLWWHPLAWWSRRQLRAASESAADEASLVVPGGPDALAECLIALGHRLTGVPRPAWLSVEGTGFRSSLGRRVERLLSLPGHCGSAPRRRRLAVTGLGLPVVLVMVAAIGTAWVRPQVTLAEGETNVSLLNTPWRRSLAAVALLGWIGSAGDLPAGEPGGEEPTWSVLAEDAPPEERQRQEAEQRHRDAQRHQEGLEREQQELEEQSQRLEAELREIPEHEGDRREQLHRELGTIRERLEQMERRASERPRHEGPPAAWEELRDRVAELFSRRQSLQEQGEQIRREMDEMRDGPDSERVRDVRRRLEEVKREAEEVARAAMEMAQRQKREVQEQVERLRQSGQHEAAERAMRQANKWMEDVKRMSGQRRESKRDGLPDDLERRIQHLKVAIENLHAADFHEPAERLRQDVDRLIREHRERAERQQDRPRGEGHPQGPPQQDRPRGEGHPQGPPQHDRPHGEGQPQGPPQHDRPHGERHPQGPPQHDRPHGEGHPQGPPQHDRPHGEGHPQGPPQHGPAPEGELRGVIEQMRAEQRQIRNEMQELREMLKNALGREQHERPEGDRPVH